MEDLDGFSYSPWLVSNVTVDSLPTGQGAPLSWDNVSVHSESLGYVVATHQNIAVHPKGTVLMHYWLFPAPDSAAERRRLGARSAAEWAELVLDDLEQVHPDIRDHVVGVECMLHAHAMIRPRPGFMWHGKRQKIVDRFPKSIQWVHSDLSGISIFEEAYVRGTKAAQTIASARRANARAG